MKETIKSILIMKRKRQILLLLALDGTNPKHVAIRHECLVPVPLCFLHCVFEWKHKCQLLFYVSTLGVSLY
jgi:hypothetical protein